MWRRLTAGMPFGRPLAEWAYITPSHLGGLTTSDLQLASADDQAETAQFSFLSNYEPFINDERCSVSVRLILGLGGLLLLLGTPLAILEGEFDGVVRAEILSAVAGQLGAQAAEWTQIAGPPGRMPLEDPEPDAVRNQLEERLQGLEAEVAAIKAAYGKRGHNQGPPLLNEAQRIE